MTRDLPSPVETSLNSDSIDFAVLAQFDFVDGVQRLWSGPQGYDLEYPEGSGTIWKGIGSLGEIDKMSEGTDLRDARTVARLRASSEMLDQVDINADANIERPAELILLFFDENGNSLGDLDVEYFMGGTRGSFREREEDEDRIIEELIEMTLLSKTSLLGRTFYRTQTHKDTLNINPNDYGNEFASDPDMGTLGTISDQRRMRPPKGRAWFGGLPSGHQFYGYR